MLQTDVIRTFKTQKGATNSATDYAASIYAGLGEWVLDNGYVLRFRVEFGTFDAAPGARCFGVVRDSLNVRALTPNQQETLLRMVRAAYENDQNLQTAPQRFADTYQTGLWMLAAMHENFDKHGSEETRDAGLATIHDMFVALDVISTEVL